MEGCVYPALDFAIAKELKQSKVIIDHDGWPEENIFYWIDVFLNEEIIFLLPCAHQMRNMSRFGPSYFKREGDAFKPGLPPGLNFPSPG